MSNMSYCMFENTLIDLIDCKRNLQDRNYQLDGLDEYDKPLSKTEAKACEQLLMLCRELAETFEQELDDLDKNL